MTMDYQKITNLLDNKQNKPLNLGGKMSWNKWWRAWNV